jgi:hypothetical protein
MMLQLAGVDVRVNHLFIKIGGVYEFKKTGLCPGQDTVLACDQVMKF